jgi:hypothetical protein
MIRWLGKVEPNTVNAKILSSLDWFPTIGFLAGYTLKSSVTYDGVDVTAALFTAAESPRTSFFFHSTSHIICDGIVGVVESSAEDAEIRAARWGAERWDAAAHWPEAAAPTTCNYTRNVGIAAPVVDGSRGVLKNVSSQQECCQRCLANSRCAASAWHSPEYTGDNASQLDCYLHTGSTLGATGPEGHGIISCLTGRKPSPPPPPKPAPRCMPLVMAVRQGKYKLHMW